MPTLNDITDAFVATQALVKQAIDDMVAEKNTLSSQFTAQIAALQAEIARLQKIIDTTPTPTPPTPTPPTSDPKLPTVLVTEADIRAEFKIPSSVPVTIIEPTDTRDPYTIRKAIPKGVLAFRGRPTSRLIDTSRGFPASGVNFVDGPGGTKTPVVSTLALWFEMMRIGDGIVGMGLDTVFELGPSIFTAPQQPVPQRAYFTAGGSMELSGAQYGVFGGWGSEASQGSKVYFGNLTMKGRDIGGAAYAAMKFSAANAVIRRVNMDGAWRSWDGKPNGESGALAFQQGTYDIDGATLKPVNAASPIMLNSCTAGSLRNVTFVNRPTYGMLAYWFCSGMHTLDAVVINGGVTGINNEQPEGSGMSLDFRSGEINILPAAQGGLYHYNGSSPNFSSKVHFSKDVKVTGGAVEGKICLHQYLAEEWVLVNGVSTKRTLPPKQRKSDITSDGPELVFFGDAWLD